MGTNHISGMAAATFVKFCTHVILDFGWSRR